MNSWFVLLLKAGAAVNIFYTHPLTLILGLFSWNQLPKEELAGRHVFAALIGFSKWLER